MRPRALDEVRHEVGWVVELAVHVYWQRKRQVVSITVAIQDVKNGAAGRLVRFQEDNMVLGLTRAASVARCLFGVRFPIR